MVNINQLGTLALVVVVGAFIISIGSVMLDTLYDNLDDSGVGTGCQTGNKTNCTVAQNTTLYGLDGMGTFAQWLPLIALVVVLAIVIGVIVRFMGGATGGM